MRVAVIDVGTNSTRLLIAEVNRQKEVKPLHTDLVTTRLGKGIGTAKLMPSAIGNTVTVIDDYLKRTPGWQVEKVVIAATSAVRNAVNREDFLRTVFKRTGLEVKVLSGAEEALLSYQGALSGLHTGFDSQNAVVMDLGGGSTEFTWKTPGGLSCRSVEVGVVRATEGNFTDAEILSLLVSPLQEIRKISPVDLIGVGGTVTTIAAISLSLRVYNPELVHGFDLSAGQVEKTLSLLTALPLEKRRCLPGLQPERADIIIAGVRIVKQILLYLELPRLKVSEADLMYGLAIRESDSGL
ncbi:MAG: Ppx/GppA phosphatase [Desulfotomaculum sp. 46_296]|nr:MAG: Ppx/GppA phosphatase [Desulfotomaculum sp. 46_296]KUK84725.1 MAG: Ppx/GppA phosphatase [Desulfofundulus kuznetsovii]HAU32571.1 phosphatase [Desulfotomaculum sp.]